MAAADGDDDDALLLLVDGELIAAGRSTLSQCSAYFQSRVAALGRRRPAVLALALPGLDLPPFFNRRNHRIRPVLVFRLYYACLRRRAAADFGDGLQRLETCLLASFAILSHHFAVDDMHAAVDAALCHRFGRLLCEETLQFARRCRLPDLHRRSLAALICRRSFAIETTAGVTLQEISDRMAPGFLACRDPLTEIVKFAGRLALGRRSIRAEILHRRCQVVIDDPKRLAHFRRWLVAVVAGLERRDQLQYALDVADCIRAGPRRRRLPVAFLDLLTNAVYAQIDSLSVRP